MAKMGTWRGTLTNCGTVSGQSYLYAFYRLSRHLLLAEACVSVLVSLCLFHTCVSLELRCIWLIYMRLHHASLYTSLVQRRFFALAALLYHEISFLYAIYCIYVCLWWCLQLKKAFPVLQLAPKFGAQGSPHNLCALVAVLCRAGFRSMKEMIGRSDFLRQKKIDELSSNVSKASTLDFTDLLEPVCLPLLVLLFATQIIFFLLFCVRLARH